MPSLFRPLLAVSATAAVAAACASFASSPTADIADANATDAGTDAGEDAIRPPSDGGLDATPTFLYVFGGISDPKGVVANTERASIRADGTLGPWELVPAPDLPRGGMAFMMTPSGLVVAAGAGDTGPTTDVSRISLVGGQRLKWEVLAPLPTLSKAVFGAGMAIGDRAFVTGGTTTGAVGGAVNQIVELGTSSWKAAGTLPDALTGHALSVVGSRAYLVGGYSGGALPSSDARSMKTFQATVGADGRLSSWLAAGSLPTPTAHHVLAHVDDWLFSIGGLTSDTHKGTDTIHRATIQSDGGLAWEAIAPLSRPGVTGVGAACGVVIGRTIYVLGGRDADTSPSFTGVLVGKVDVAGDVTWSNTSELRGGRNSFACAAF